MGGGGEGNERGRREEEGRESGIKSEESGVLLKESGGWSKIRIEGRKGKVKFKVRKETG
jgi:hypothetical protein